jgi:CBS domain-containing protein
MQTKIRMSPVRGPMQAADVMTSPVECVYVGDTMESVANKFTHSKISAAPVIGTNGMPIGVITKSDITRYQMKKDRYSIEPGQRFTFDPVAETIRWWHTPAILSVLPNTSFQRVVDIMLKNDIHHVFVREKASERICGVISALDVVRCLKRLGRQHAL